jgi:protein SCO1/2
VNRRATLIAGIALVCAGVAVALIAGLSGGGKRHDALVGPSMPPHFRAARFELRDSSGRSFALDRPGRVVVLTFLHSLCKSTCPVTAQTIRGALDDLTPAQRRQIDTYAVSVAPREDTPAHVRSFLREQGVGSFLHYLTGPLPAVRAVWKRYGIQPNTQGEDHSAFILLVDRRGIVRVGYPSHQTVPEDLAHDLRILVGSPA